MNNILVALALNDHFFLFFDDAKCLRFNTGLASNR